MKSLTEDGHPAGLVVVETWEDRCDICPSFRAGRRARSCTSLLYDPRETFSQRNQWPDHLCYSDFMQRSVEAWVSKAVGQLNPAIEELWAECYPLPIGETAARHLYARTGQGYPDALRGFLPFDGTQEAYWSLRVDENRSVLDMFGLKGPTPPGDAAHDHLWFGRFAYSLRGYDDTALVRLMRDGAAWWRDVSCEKIQGRPRGSGAWESRRHFELGLIEAIRGLRSRGPKSRKKRSPTCSRRTIGCSASGCGISI